MSRWKSFRYRLEESACALVAWGVPRLSRLACVRLGNFLGNITYALDARGREVAIENIKAAFGDRFSPERRREIARQSYRNFLRTMLDLFWASRLNQENWEQWIHVEGIGLAELRRLVAERKRNGAVFLCIHQGNWEWAGLVGGFTGFPLTIVAESFKNPRLTAIFKRAREGTGQEIIAQENSLLRMLKIVKRGGLTAMLIDLNLRPSQAATIIDCHGPDGLKMCVPLLHAVLAQRAGTLLLPVEPAPQPNGVCKMIVHPPVQYPAGATLHEIVQACWDAFEKILRARPGDYLWAYKHFRYKPRKAGRPYPLYANESSAFEKLLKQVAQEDAAAAQSKSEA